jgi:uncharacterized protein YxjI
MSSQQTPVSTNHPIATRFSHQTYLLRKKFWQIFGGSFYIYDPNGALVLFSKMKAFKLKEDIRVFTDETLQTEALSIQARSVLDFSGSYDVYDSKSGQRVGALRRKGLKSSFYKDEWVILDNTEREIGLIQEESAFLALLRKYLLGALIPQSFTAQMGGRTVATFSQHFNLFATKLTLDFSADPQHQFDRRLGLAAGILLCAIEGKQRSD